MAGFVGPESVDTSVVVAGFAFDSLGRPRRRTAMLVAIRLAADRLTPDARSGDRVGVRRNEC
jgi:hypothetical protein